MQQTITVTEPSGDFILLLGGAAVILVLFTIVFALLKKFLYVCAPNEVFVFSGRSRTLPDGSTVGYRILHGGWALRVPLLETFSRMDVRLAGVEVSVANAFSRGGIPLTVHAIANVKISTDPARVRQAVERFLGMDQQKILMIARQTLEGVLREVLSQLTPEEVNQNRLKFAESLALNAKDDFDKLGLELDVLKVQHVSDDQKYLVNLGRAQIATMIRDAENAENVAHQEVQQAQAGARQMAETATRQGEATVLTAQNGLRAELARLKAEVAGIENEAGVAQETSRAIAEQELQLLRGQLAKLYLQVEQVLPAEAGARAAIALARGDAAPTIETGRATAEALSLIVEQWGQSGSDGREAYVLQHLDVLVRAAIERMQRLQIEELQIVDGGDGSGISSAVAAYPLGVMGIVRETCNAMGVDLDAVLTGKSLTSGTGGSR